jgi:D-arabinose 1-dehydrogenase-like Zn-dependent alcohol dehydrogenase
LRYRGSADSAISAFNTLGKWDSAIAIGRGGDRAELAKKLGAHDYIDSGTGGASDALQKLGGADVILATAPDSKSISALVNGLGPNGKLLLIGARPEPLNISPIQLIAGSRKVAGWASGTAKDSEETIEFSALFGIRPMIEKYLSKRPTKPMHR